MNTARDAELAIIGWILQSPADRYPVIEKHLNHGAAFSVPFLGELYRKIGQLGAAASDEALILEYGESRFDVIGGVDKFRMAEYDGGLIFGTQQAAHLASKILDRYRRNTEAHILKAAVQAIEEGSGSLLEIESDLDRRIAEFRQYNPGADELLRASEWLEDFPGIERKPDEPILENLWNRSEWASIIARSGEGKSYLGLQFVADWKAGEPFLGFPTHGGDTPVGIISPELGANELERRYADLSNGTLHPGVACLHKENVPAGFDLATEQSRRAVVTWIESLRLGLIVIDPLTACYHGQLWGEPMLPLVQWLFDLHRLTRTGCGLLLIHHESENDKADGKRTGRGLGDSRLDQRPRLIIRLAREKGSIRLQVTKSNAWKFGELPGFWLSRDPSGRFRVADAPDETRAAKTADADERLLHHIIGRGGEITTIEAMGIYGGGDRATRNALTRIGCQTTGLGKGARWFLPNTTGQESPF